MWKAVISLIFLIQGVGYAATLQESRNTIQEWVRVEKALSQEKSAWEEKRQTLETLSLILEKEEEQLLKKIESEQKKTTIGDTQREDLRAQEKVLATHQKEIKAFLDDIEQELLALKVRLPAPLIEKTEGAFLRIPKHAQETRFSVAERMQTVVGILLEIQNFNDVITVTQEMRTLKEGGEGEMSTIYLGLGAAYYLMPDGRDAGYGFPAEKGWDWKSEPALAERLQEFIAVYSRSSREARFIPLPVSQVSNP